MSLPANAHVAILFCDSIGDFVVALPLLQAIQEVYPESVVDYFGGSRTAELERSCALISARCDLFDDVNIDSREAVLDFCATRINAIGPYNLTINLDNHPIAAWAAAATKSEYVVGQCLSIEDGRLVPQSMKGIDALQLENWADESLMDRYNKQLRSQYIGDIFCAISHMPYPVSFPSPPLSIPSYPIPDLLLGLGASRPAKLWPAAYWNLLIKHAHALGLSVGILGAQDSIQRKYYGSWDVEQELIRSLNVVDLRGKLTLPEVSGALSQARACVSIDNGIMHLAAAAGTPTVALFGGSAWNVWAPPLSNLRVVKPAAACDLCRLNRFRNKECLLDENICMASCYPSAAIAALEEMLTWQGKI